MLIPDVNTSATTSYTAAVSSIPSTSRIDSTTIDDMDIAGGPTKMRGSTHVQGDSTGPSNHTSMSDDTNGLKILCVCYR